MAKDSDKIKDPGSERALLGTILKHGKDALIDAQAVLSSTDFSLPLNREIYKCLEDLANDPKCEFFDTESIKLKAKTLGFDEHLNQPKALEYLELLPEIRSEPQNIPMFSLQIKKYSIARELYQRYEDAKQYLGNITGNETLSEIITNAESSITQMITGINSNSGICKMGEDIESYIQELIERQPVDQVGLSTGFPIYDQCIGGGPRPGTVTVIGARVKQGKSWDALNKSRNAARRGIPVLYLDTELTQLYQKHRLLSVDSGCPIYMLETSKFKHDKQLVEKVQESGKRIKDYPISYQNISGMGHVEALAVARKWLIKNVGFNEKGQANPCLIVYDYLKLTDGSSLTKFTPEYILLGLMLTELSVFAIKYNIPILGYVQLNREGIEGTDTSIVAGSDRILWICSSFSIIRNKDDTDTQLGCGFENGNKKVIVMETRQGPGMPYESDYINLRCSLRPGVDQQEATGLITEGLLFSELSAVQGNNGNDNRTQENRSSGSREYSKSSQR